MSRSPLESAFHRLGRWAHETISRPLPEGDLRQPAVVFAPHPDDETLGCGGTIAKKRSLLAPVTIVFMTDGSASHPDLMPKARMREVRKSEALEAARALGVPEESVVFLDFGDGELHDRRDAALERVSSILRCHREEDVFVPYHRDGTSDHNATHDVVTSAIAHGGGHHTVYEYPIWYWHRWPSVSRQPYHAMGRREYVTWGLGAMVRLLKDFRISVWIADHLGTKRRALDRYESQVSRLVPDERWWTLPGLADGEFLECFFQDHEFFRVSACRRLIDGWPTDRETTASRPLPVTSSRRAARGRAAGTGAAHRGRGDLRRPPPATRRRHGT